MEYQRNWTTANHRSFTSEGDSTVYNNSETNQRTESSSLQQQSTMPALHQAMSHLQVSSSTSGSQPLNSNSRTFVPRKLSNDKSFSNTTNFSFEKYPTDNYTQQSSGFGRGATEPDQFSWKDSSSVSSNGGTPTNITRQPRASRNASHRSKNIECSTSTTSDTKSSCKEGGSDPEKEFLIGTFQNMAAAGCDPLRYRTALCDYVSVAKCQYKSCFFHHIDDHLSKRTVSENAKECTQLLMYLVEDRLETKKELQQLKNTSDRSRNIGTSSEAGEAIDSRSMSELRQEQQHLSKLVNSLESECGRLQQQLEICEEQSTQLQQENKVLRSLIQPVTQVLPSGSQQQFHTQNLEHNTNSAATRQAASNVRGVHSTPNSGLGNGTFGNAHSSTFASFNSLPHLPSDVFDRSGEHSN